MTTPRLTAWAAMIGIASGATVLGAGWAGFRTEPGRELLTRVAVDLLSDVVRGHAEVESIGGNILTGLVIRNLTIRDDDGELFVRLPSVTIRYRLLDLLSSRVVLGQVILEEPFIHIYQNAKGQFNHERVLGLGGDGEGGGGRSPLVAFRDAQVTNGTIVVRTPVDSVPADAEWEVSGRMSERPLRLYRFYDIDARIPYARIVSPFEGEAGLEFDIQHLSAVINDPHLEIQDLRGGVSIDGTTMSLQLDRLRLPETLTGLSGQIRWPDGNFLVDLDAETEFWAFDDIAAFAPRLPWGMAGDGHIKIASLGIDSLFVRADDLVMRGPAAGGEIAGDIGLLVGSGGLSAVLDARLQFTNLDLEYVRPLLDTLPFAGRLDGQLVANGPVDSMNVQIDWRFRDSLVADWPATLIRGNGNIYLDEQVGLGFQEFRVDSGLIDLRTVNNMFPAVVLQGSLRGNGTLNGSLSDIVFDGSLWHRDGNLPVTAARGTLRLNSERDTLGLWADFTLDSLRLAGIQPSYPIVPGSGAFAGELAIGGYADSMALHALVSGPPGFIRAEGTVVMLPHMLALLNLRSAMNDLDLSALHDELLPTEIYGHVAGNVIRGTASPLAVNLELRLDTSFVASSEIDSLRAEVNMADSLLATPQLNLWSRAMDASARGTFGLGGSSRGALSISMAIDSLGWFLPLVQERFPFARSTDLLANLDGEASALVNLDGTLGDFGVAIAMEVDELRSDSAYAHGTSLDVAWHSDFARDMHIRFAMDTLAEHGRAYSDVSVVLSGPKGSAQWDARARIGQDASLAAWGLSFADQQNIILPFDSLRMLLPAHTWDLSRGALIAASDSGLVFSNFVVQSVDAGSRLELTGRFPTNGSAALRGDFVALPVTDLWALMQRDPTTVSGTMSGDFVLAGTAVLPQLTSSLAVTQARFGAVRLPQLQGTLDYQNQVLVGDYEVRRSGESILALDFSLPLDLALRPVAERQLDGPLSVVVTAEGVDLALVELFTRNVRRAGGALDANVGINGTWNSPRLTGTATIVGGQADILPIGVTHRNLIGAFTLSGDSIIVDTVSVRAGSGQLGVTGVVRLANLADPVLDLRLQADEFRTIDVPEFMTLITSGSIQLTGPLFGATLTGNATVTEGQVYFADLVEKRIIDLEDELVSQLADDEFFRRVGLRLDEGQRLVRGRFENRFLNELRIDNLSMTMGNNVRLRSTEANIQLAGQVNVDKRGNVYRLDGTLNTPRGTYLMPLGGDVIGGFTREFNVTGGDVTYPGTVDWNAQLDINAQHVVRSLRREDVTIFVNIGGTLFDPRLTLSSDRQPPLPQSEIIAYLLFGTPSVEAALGGEDSGMFVGGQLADFFSSPFEQLLLGNGRLPLDYLRIQPQPLQGYFGVTVGKQLGERTFVTLSPRICPNQTTLVNVSADLEFRLTRSWLFSFNTEPVVACSLIGSSFTRVDNRQQFGADFFWDRRFR